MSNLIRYKCNNKKCECDYFRGGPNERECPLCGSTIISIVKYGVKE